ETYVWPLQRLVPTIVNENALAVGRVVRDDLVKQRRVVPELRTDEPLHELTVTIVGPIDRSQAVRPFRINLQRFVQPIGERPEQLESIPARIEGNVLQHPFLPRGYLQEVVRIGYDPMG